MGQYMLELDPGVLGACVRTWVPGKGVYLDRGGKFGGYRICADYFDNERRK